ncbi:DUF6438 domain-containing protein [Flavobacterium macrobrachii]|jgi:hypothetical protein|uniref:DUF6438 domain-containing protein n=1 Tax=Flavobacterium macrobrachii TaxID=591204 RepID=UPI0037BE95B5
MKKSLSIFVLILLFSCQKKESNPNIGNWYFDQIVDYDSTKIKFPKIILETEFAPYYNFEILNDSVLDYKQGFYYTITNKVWNGNERHHFLRSYYFLGSKTKYKIDKSNILFFDKTSKDWDTIRIKKISNDTMIVQGYENAFYRLIKKQNNHFDDKSYDAITVDRSPCFGSCPFNSTYLDRNGNFFFKAYSSNTQIKNSYSKLDSSQVKYYFNLFDKIPIFDLKDNYSIQATDGQTNTISFFKNGKIVKTISCYMKTPIDLQKAYSELSYAYQNVRVEDDFEFLFMEKVNLFSFETSNSEFRLKESESFFLEVALRNGKQVKTEMNSNYNLKFSDWNEVSDVLKITTDGRFYQIMMKDKTIKTIDIGNNFIEKNPIIKKNREN